MDILHYEKAKKIPLLSEEYYISIYNAPSKVERYNLSTSSIVSRLFYDDNLIICFIYNSYFLKEVSSIQIIYSKSFFIDGVDLFKMNKEQIVTFITNYCYKKIGNYIYYVASIKLFVGFDKNMKIDTITYVHG